MDRRARVNLFSLLGLLALVALLWIAPETREMGSRIKQDLRNRLQRPEPAKPPESLPEEATPSEPVQAEPEPAAEVTPPPHVEKNAAGEYVPEPGYTWVNSEPGNFDVQWCPGCRHRDSPNLIAGSEEGAWHPAPGYDWADPQHDLSLVWKPGLRHPEHEHVIAGDIEGQWFPEEGYTWVDADDSENLDVVPEPPS
jgi:hypothetical protein